MQGVIALQQHWLLRVLQLLGFVVMPLLVLALCISAPTRNIGRCKSRWPQGCSADVKDRDGCTPLYCAAAWNRVEAVKELAALSCASSLQSEEGRMSVHVAAEQGWTHLIDVLVTDLHNQVGGLLSPECANLLKTLLAYLSQ